jgi:hypothetical protein
MQVYVLSLSTTHKLDVSNPHISFHFRFPCGRWLAKNVDDGSTERLLVAELIKTKNEGNCVMFDLILHVGGRGGGGRFIRIFITMT